MECLRSGKPLLKKAYWYATSTNFLASTVTDFFPLFDHGQKDGVIAFTIWTGNTAHISETRRPLKFDTDTDQPNSYYTFSDIVGQDAALQECIREARSAAEGSSPVMIWGESGTGKELFAQAIHSASSRASSPFIPVNCAAIPKICWKAFSSAPSRGPIPTPRTNPACLKKPTAALCSSTNSIPCLSGFRQNCCASFRKKRVRRLGSHTELPVNVRIISILNEHPLRAVEQGLLRRDLFYRLAVVGIAVPPLRKRQGDIPLLVRHVIAHSETAHKKQCVNMDDDVMRLFREYAWPGNIRELAHVIEGSLALLGNGDVITAQNLPRHFREACNQLQGLDDLLPPFQPPQSLPFETAATTGENTEYFDYRAVRRSDSISLKTCLREYESCCIRNVLRITGGNVAKAARIMELTPAGLHYRMKVLHITNDE